jgi:biopolymer transport protein ExbD
MRLPDTRTSRRPGDVAMTPMIDVVFQLMIFFICTASFQMAEELLPTSLADSGGSSEAAPIEVEPDLERIVAHATQTGGETRWTVNERACGSLAEVQQVLRAVAEIDRTLPVVLDVEGQVPLGNMIDVYDLCRLTGFEKIQFAAKQR